MFSTGFTSFSVFITSFLVPLSITGSFKQDRLGKLNILSIDSPSNWKEAALFIAWNNYSRADWDDLRNHLKDISREVIFKLGASAAASEVFESFQVWINMYISLKVKSHSSLWFSASCAAVIIYRNLWFCLHQQNKSSESKVKLRQASNHFKNILKAAKLAWANKTRVFHFPETWLSEICWIANSVLSLPYTSWTLQYVSGGILFSRLLEGLISNLYI